MSLENPISSPPPPGNFPTLLLRAFFHLLYHSLAWTYDLVASIASVGRWQNWVISIASLVSGPKVLELGYGTGHLQTHLSVAGLAVFGLDESRQMARQAARRLARRGFIPRLVRGLAQSLPFPAQTFDNVVATFPTLYIVDPQALFEIKRVLRPGGRLIVLNAAWITGKSLPDRLMNFVFRITNQAPSLDQELREFIQPFLEAGFQAGLRFIELPDSQLMVILATREETNDFYHSIEPGT